MKARTEASTRKGTALSLRTPGQRKAFDAGRSFQVRAARVAAGGSARAARLPMKVLRSQHQRRAFMAGRLYESEQARLKARMFEAAKTTRVNQKHWAGALQMDAESAIGPDVLALRNRSRYEFYNNGYARGIAKTWRSDSLGYEGPALKVRSIALGAKRDADGVLAENEDFNDALEWGWYDWCEVCDLSGQQEFPDLFGARLEELWHAGEFFLQLRSDGDAPGPVKLRLFAIEPERVATPAAMIGRDDVHDGIRVDANGKPIEYYVLKRHPGSTRPSPATGECETVLAKDMIHVYVRERAGQFRGYPWLGPTLEVWAQLRDYIGDTLLAARVAAMFSGFVYTDHQTLDLDDLEGELPIFDMEPGTLTTLPMGWKFAQSKPEHPATTFREFKREQLSEAGRPEGVPYLKIAADAAGHNYSSARFDDQGYWSRVGSVQGWLSRVLLKRLLRLIASELRLENRLPEVARWWPTWVWPAPRHVDPGKEADGARGRLAILSSTHERECMANGLDPDEVLTSAARTRRRCRQLGLPDPYEAAAKIPPAAPAPEEPAGDGGNPPRQPVARKPKGAQPDDSEE